MDNSFAKVIFREANKLDNKRIKDMQTTAESNQITFICSLPSQKQSTDREN